MMQTHTKVYFKHFDYGEQDFIPCEICGQKAVDVHHIRGRGKGKDVIENLMAVCRRCHIKVHHFLHKDIIEMIHKNYLNAKKK